VVEAKGFENLLSHAAFAALILVLVEAWRAAGEADGPRRQRLVAHLRAFSTNEHLTELGLRDAGTGGVLLKTPGNRDDAGLRATHHCAGPLQTRRVKAPPGSPGQATVPAPCAQGNLRMGARRQARSAS
jgi:hypothetical protein